MNISIIENNQTMSSREIAKLTNKEHKNVLRVIRELLDGDILDAQYEPLKFNYRGQSFDYFELNKRDSIILVARLSPQFMAAIIDRWSELEQKLIEKELFKEARQVSKNEYKPMTIAISEAHEEIKPYHFSNESDLINRIVLGCTASKYRTFHEIPKSDAIRDYLNQAELDCIIALQRANTVYIEDGINFQDRKEKLTSLYNRKHKQKIINEIHRLSA